jgi:hypothetical protein
VWRPVEAGYRGLTIVFQLQAISDGGTSAWARATSYQMRGLVQVEGGVPYFADRSWVAHGSPGKPTLDR